MLGDQVVLLDMRPVCLVTRKSEADLSALGPVSTYPSRRTEKIASCLSATVAAREAPLQHDVGLRGHRLGGPRRGADFAAPVWDVCVRLSMYLEDSGSARLRQSFGYVLI